MGHLARFIPPGSVRVKANTYLTLTQHTDGDAGLDAAMFTSAAFITPDDEKVFLLINIGYHTAEFFLHVTDANDWDKGWNGGTMIKIGPRSAQTWTWRSPQTMRTVQH